MEESAEPGRSDGNDRRSLRMFISLAFCLHHIDSYCSIPIYVAALQCHKRLRMISNGRLISDDHSRMTCNNGEVCGRMLVVGSPVVGVISGTNICKLYIAMSRFSHYCRDGYQMFIISLDRAIFAHRCYLIQYRLVSAVTNEMLHCIPQSMCDADCRDISPPDESIVVKSCQLSCCNMDMCNASPDTPDVAVTATSASLPFWLKPPGTGNIPLQQTLLTL